MYFPIPLVETLKNLRFREFDAVRSMLVESGGPIIEPIKLNHPGGAAGYIVEKNDRKVCCFLDHEYGQLDKVDNELLIKANNCDLVIWDGMFLDEELPPKFCEGQAVRAKNVNGFAHNRLPRYVRGKVGIIFSINGVYALQDTNEEEEQPYDTPENVYTVRFSSTELWGDDGNENDCIYIDAWESYLDFE